MGHVGANQEDCRRSKQVSNNFFPLDILHRYGAAYVQNYLLHGGSPHHLGDSLQIQASLSGLYRGAEFVHYHPFNQPTKTFPYIFVLTCQLHYSALLVRQSATAFGHLLLCKRDLRLLRAISRHGIQKYEVPRDHSH